MSTPNTPYRFMGVSLTGSAYNEIVLTRDADIGRKLSISTTHGIAATEPKGSISGFALNSQGAKTAKQTRILCQVLSITDMEHSPHYPALCACGGDGGEIHIIKANTDIDSENVIHRLGTLKAYSNKRIAGVNWNPVGDCVLASACLDGSLELWDLQTTQAKERRSIHKPWNCDWSPDGRLMATCDRNGGVNILDPRSPKTTQSRSEHAFKSPKPGQVRWIYDYKNLDGKNLAAVGFDGASIKKIKLFDIRNFGNAVWEEKVPGGSNNPTMHYDPTHQLIFCFSKGEPKCVAYIYSGGAVRLLKEVTFGKSATSVAFGPKRCVDTTKTELVKVYRTEPEAMRISVASFNVVRKEYAEDIYGSLPSGMPALSRDLWFSGKDADVSLTQFRSLPSGEQQFADAPPPELPLALPPGAE